MLDIYDEYQGKPVQILSVNAINPAGRVEADAAMFEVPFPVLVGRETSIITDYGLSRLPQILIIDFEGNVVLSERYVEYETIVESIDTLIQKWKNSKE